MTDHHDSSAANGEAAIERAAREATLANRVYRSEGDLWTDTPINLSKFVRFLALQPHVVPTDAQPEQLRLEWRDGAPSKPWALEWFIAETTFGDRVCLVALPDEWTYDFKTADDTYIKADKIKRWMQFPDSNFIAPASQPSPAATVETLKHLVDWTYLHASEGEVWPSSKTADDLIRQASERAPKQADADFMKRKAVMKDSRLSAGTSDVVNRLIARGYLREDAEDIAKESGDAGCGAAVVTPWAEEPLAKPDGAFNEPQRSAGNEDALGYAQRLATILWEKHWKDGAPEWRPLPDVVGVLTQIDNMVAGLSRAEPQPTQDQLAVIEDNCWDLRCIDVPTGGDDYDIVWNIVEHHQAAPKERVVGRGRSPIAALQDAMSPLSRPVLGGEK